LPFSAFTLSFRSSPLFHRYLAITQYI
jgi:hypothetical protein